MADVAVGQAWEMYSADDAQWHRVIVAKIDGDSVTLRYEGVMEFISMDVDDFGNPDLFRPAEIHKPSP